MADVCDCFKGTAGDGSYKESGVIAVSEGVTIYRSRPREGRESKAVLLFYPDAFGLATHNRILADKYAAFGYDVTVVDYFEGDALPVAFMRYNHHKDINTSEFTPEELRAVQAVDLPKWLARHDPTKISSILDPFFLKFRKTVPATAKIFVLGHCFGGKYAFQLAATTEKVTSSLIMHPSFLVPGDIQDLHRPVFVGLAETDIFTPDLIQKIFSVCSTWKNLFKISIYGKTRHGFASRANLKEEFELHAFRSGFEDTLRWMERLL